MLIKSAVIVVAMFSIFAIACKSSDQPQTSEPAAQVLKNATETDAAKVGQPRAGTIVGGQTAPTGLSPLAPLPVMTLGYQSGVIEGDRGSYCWPESLDPGTGAVRSLCADGLAPAELTDGVPVQAGDTLTALIEADKPASELSVSVFTADMGSMVNFEELGASGSFVIPSDLPSGIYALNLFGRWDEGDAMYTFAVEVGSSVTFAADKMPTAGQCLPAMDVLVSVGDHWTVSGLANIPVDFPGELPKGLAKMSTTVVVENVEKTTGKAERNGPEIDQVSLSTLMTETNLDADGDVLSSEQNLRTHTPLAVSNLGPVLTPDWACHQVAWMEGWPDGSQPMTGERTLASGITAVVFSVEQPFVVEPMGIDAVMQRHHGYDKATGRMVLSDVVVAGSRNGQPFDMSMHQEIENSPIGASAPNRTVVEREAKNILITQDPTPGPRMVMQALMFGSLLSDNGCLRVQEANSDASHLVIWPPSYKLGADVNQVLDEAGEAVAVVGQGVRLSGGEVPAYQRIPDKCNGPFWVVGDEVSVADLKSGLNTPNSVTGPTIVDSSPVGEQDAFLRDAQSYAEDTGVSLEEAVRRMELQDSIGELGARLQANESGTFGGLWVQNEPDYRVVIRFTRDGETTIRRYVPDGPLAEVIEVIGADATLVELRQAQQDTERILQRLGIESNSGVDVICNRVDLYVFDTGALESTLDNAGTDLPASVRVVAADILAASARDGNS
jgi:hypothetical protein